MRDSGAEADARSGSSVGRSLPEAPDRDTFGSAEESRRLASGGAQEATAWAARAARSKTIPWPSWSGGVNQPSSIRMGSESAPRSVSEPPSMFSRMWPCGRQQSSLAGEFHHEVGGERHAEGARERRDLEIGRDAADPDHVP